MSTESRRVDIICDLLRTFPVLSSTGLAPTTDATARDDCAIIPLAGDHDLVVGSDFVRGEGFELFKLGLLSRQDIGRYVVGANASDLAAMGATPLALTLIYRYTETTTDDDFRAVMEGAALACRQYEVPLVGGDTGSYQAPVLSATAFGLCRRGRALLRSAARPGDLLFLTGDIGRAVAAYRYFPVQRQGGERLSSAVEDELLAPWRQIEVALAQGRFLAESGLSRCAMDTSDGLFAAAHLLAHASNVDIVINQRALPVRDSVKQVANYLGIDWAELAGGVSVDFRLLFSARAEAEPQLVDHFSKCDWPIYRIGHCKQVSTTASAFMESQNGTLRQLQDCW